MLTWFRSFFDEDNVWQYFEVGDDGWARRQVDLRGDEAQPLTAATLNEVLHLRDHADLAAMQRYERQFGVLAEARSTAGATTLVPKRSRSPSSRRSGTDARSALNTST